MLEADDLDAAIDLASRTTAARMGGAIEMRAVLIFTCCHPRSRPRPRSR
jgi:hypothetical protein